MRPPQLTIRAVSTASLAVFAVVLGATAAPVPALALEPSGVPAVGDRAPELDLPVVGSDRGEYLSLERETRRGAVVVIFLRGYPGYQCGICSRQLSGILNRSKTLARRTARVILVYPGAKDGLTRHSQQFLGSRRLPDSVVIVRDDDFRATGDWGLRWDARRETAYPSTFIIDPNGRVAWKKISTSHAGRSTVDEILKALRSTG